MAQKKILTIQEVAELLRVSERTIYDWATKGKIPCGKLSGTWRFQRSEIDKWINNKLGANKTSTIPFSIFVKDVLSPERSLILNTVKKEEALTRLIDSLADAPEVNNKKELTKEIFSREELMSTEIGLGIGLPHVRLESVENIVMAVGINKSEIGDYGSLDGEPVRIICMIVAGKNQHKQHIKTVAAISNKLKDAKLRNTLLEAKDNTAVFNILN